MRPLFKTAFEFLAPHAVSLSPAALSYLAQGIQANSLEMNGGIMNDGALIAALQALANNAAPNSGSVNSQSSAAATITLTNLANLNLLLTNGGAVTVTLDNAFNVVNQIPGPLPGMTFPARISCIAGTSVAAPTVTNTGITLAGTTTVSANSYRDYKGQITQLYAGTNQIQPLTSGTTFTSLANAATNTYTLTIAGNSIATTIGNIIYIGTTAGTLPPGWYMIVSSSSTAPVIVAPPAAASWTCTAVASPVANAVSNMQQPVSASGVFAPLLTLTGLYMVTGTVVA